MQGARQFTATTLPDLVVQLNTVFGQLQQGGVTLNGLKLDRTRTTAPTTAPGAQDPNLVLVDVAGVWTLYHWNGSAWAVV